jgi:hypothetical protein
MKLDFRNRWKINFESNNLEELTFNMKPPHHCTQKMLEVEPIVELLNMAPLLATPNEYH